MDVIDYCENKDIKNAAINDDGKYRLITHSQANTLRQRVRISQEYREKIFRLQSTKKIRYS